jgi:serine/threonine protein kinase
MDTELNLLFGVVAFQNGVIDADRLVEAMAEWRSHQSRVLADLFIGRGLMTVEQRVEVENTVAHEVNRHGGDLELTLAAILDARSLEVIRKGACLDRALEAKLDHAHHVQSSHVVLGALSPRETESRDRYTLTHLHAKGGMGRVWLARDGALGRQIALKELRPDQTNNSIVCSRFLYEARITAQLEHPGIVPVYELGEGKTPYYTMRFVRGRTLCEAIRAYHKRRTGQDVGPLGLIELLTTFVAVCRTVAYAHSRGILHRDLKGQNVVLGDFGEVMVLDWGLAKRVAQPQQAENPALAGQDTASSKVLAAPEDGTIGVDAAGRLGFLDSAARADDHGRASNPRSSGGVRLPSSSSSNGGANYRLGCVSNPNRPGPESGAGPEGTMQGQLLGTAAYMAPEQAQRRHDLVDQRSDVYGLGAILYEILTGHPPFSGPKTSEIIRKVCEEAVTPPRQIVAEIAPGLEAVCMKALRKTPEDRYRSAAELAQEVQRWLADEPVQAYAEPWTSRAMRWARRHKTLVSTAAGLLVTATIALAISTAFVSREKKEAEAQGQQARRAVQMLTKVADAGFDNQLDPRQQEFLESALAYYEQFTSKITRDPTVQLEHGRVYQQVGDIQRKLGRLPEAEQSYQKAIVILERMANRASAQQEPKRVLARTRTLLSDLLVRNGRDHGRAGPLYDQALDTQRPLAQRRGATAEDILRFGQTLKSQAELLRLNGKFLEAKPVYDQAIAALERAHTIAAKDAEIRDELAMAMEGRGWIQRELGDLTAAEEDHRRALGLLNALVAQFPTVPHHRESLAKVCNSLGVLGQETGRLDEAAAQLHREISLVERLTHDFPDRPEYRRALARALNVFGGVLRLQGNATEAEPVLRRAVDLDTAIIARSPEDVLVRFQLAMAHHHLGVIFLKQGNNPAAIGALRKAEVINRALAREFPEKPGYSGDLAVNLDNLALALDAAKLPGADENFRAAGVIYERLVAAYPANVDYRVWQANCLQNQGTVLADAGRVDQAEVLYRKALASLEAMDPKLPSPEVLRKQAEVLSNLGILHRGGAEDAFRRSIVISGKLLAGKTGTNSDRYNLAIAQNNLSELYIELGHLPEAGSPFTEAVANFEKLVAEAPGSMDFQHVFGIVLAGQAKWLERTSKPADAKAALCAAVEHQHRAVSLSKNAPVCALALVDHLIDLAEINRKLGAYEEAARSALEVTKAAPLASTPQACFDAARVLARLVTQAGGDSKLHQEERERLTRIYLTRTIILLREAIDSNPMLAEQIKTDSDIKILEAHPQFQRIMNTLVDRVP